MRTSLFVSGCRNRCKNCFNAVTWDFLYGKPFDQAVEDDIIASFTLEELLGKSGECRACTPHTRELLGLIDILVDGRYVEELADITLAFRGSKNQRVLDLPATLTTGEPVLYLE